MSLFACPPLTPPLESCLECDDVLLLVLLNSCATTLHDTTSLFRGVGRPVCCHVALHPYILLRSFAHLALQAAKLVSLCTLMFSLGHFDFYPAETLTYAPETSSQVPHPCEKAGHHRSAAHFGWDIADR